MKRKVGTILVVLGAVSALIYCLFDCGVFFWSESAGLWLLGSLGSLALGLGLLGSTTKFFSMFFSLDKPKEKS